ncbi:DUF2789 domain-containing protein [Rhodoferax sp.]|uniref:DUF2789 domain-containing protein n=1 Tax=Rhodoferax sp. TaxID=50421 RepID=UPI0025F3D4B2|nr:DUF2789 domain-containing protein [Rhodoferax sp.]MCM2341027.1 DUF2789 domain-containing protein [Rhodoferax sp.]
MDTAIHRFHDLFAQLGLSNDAASIGEFIRSHSPLAFDVKLSNADFWTPAQAAFLREACMQDADWAELADQLSVALRGPVQL